MHLDNTRLKHLLLVQNKCIHISQLFMRPQTERYLIAKNVSWHEENWLRPDAQLPNGIFERVNQYL